MPGLLTLIQFGTGHRIFLGKHIGIFEVKKLVPLLVLSYDVSDLVCIYALTSS